MSESTQRKKLKINSNPIPATAQSTVFPPATHLQTSFPTLSNPFNSPFSSAAESTASIVNPFNTGANQFSTSNQFKFTHSSASQNNPFNFGNSPFSSQFVKDQPTVQVPSIPTFPSISSNPFANFQTPPSTNPFQRPLQTGKHVQFKATPNNDFIPSFGPNKVSQQKITNYFKIKTQPIQTISLEKSQKQVNNISQIAIAETGKSIPVSTLNKPQAESKGGQNPFMSVQKASEGSQSNPFLSSAGNGESKNKLLNKFIRNELTTINQTQKDSQQTSQGQKSLTLKKSFSFGPSQIQLKKQKDQRAQTLKNQQLLLQRQRAQQLRKQRQQLLNSELDRVLYVVREAGQQAKDLAEVSLDVSSRQSMRLAFNFSVRTQKVKEVRRSKAKEVLSRLQKCQRELFQSLSSRSMQKSLKRLLRETCNKESSQCIDFRDIVLDQDQSPLQRQLVYFIQSYHTF